MSARKLFRRNGSGQHSASNSAGDTAAPHVSIAASSRGLFSRSGDSVSEGSASRRERRSKKKNIDADSLDAPIPRTHRSRELLDAFLDQVEKDLQENTIGSSALKQLQDIKAQLAADEDNDKAFLSRNDEPTVESGSGSLSGACISCNKSTPSDERISRNQSSEGASGDTAKAGNRDRMKKRDSRAAHSNAETVPTTVDASEVLEDEEDVGSVPSTISDDSDLTGLTGVFSANHVGHTDQKSSEKKNKGAINGNPGRGSRRHTLDTADAILEHPEDRKARSNKFVTAEKQHKDASGSGKKRAVSFQSVFVRSYERILEVNPSCTSGPSIGIGWRYEMEQEFFVDDYERLRSVERRDDLVLSRDEREDLLLDLGYTERELAHAVRNMIKDKNKRRQTVQNLNTSGAEEVLETTGRRMRNFLSRRKRGGS